MKLNKINKKELLMNTGWCKFDSCLTLGVYKYKYHFSLYDEIDKILEDFENHLFLEYDFDDSRIEVLYIHWKYIDDTDKCELIDDYLNK